MPPEPTTLQRLIPGLREPEIRELAAASREVTYQPRETVLAGGVEVFPGVVATGRLRLTARAVDGREATLRTIGVGSMFGLVTLFEPTRSFVPIERSIVAAERSNVVLLHAPTLLRLGNELPGVGMHLARNLASTVSLLGDTAGQFAFMTVRQRLAAHLVATSQTDSSGRQVAFVTQQEAANAIGSVREVVARTLQEMRRRQLVSVSPGRIEVLNPRELSEIARGLN